MDGAARRNNGHDEAWSSRRRKAIAGIQSREIDGKAAERARRDYGISDEDIFGRTRDDDGSSDPDATHQR